MRFGWPYWIDAFVKNTPRSTAVRRGPRLQNWEMSQISYMCMGEGPGLPLLPSARHGG
jgi:hypothetical protein